jgi:hypothetical protein
MAVAAGKIFQVDAVFLIEAGKGFLVTGRAPACPDLIPGFGAHRIVRLVAGAAILVSDGFVVSGMAVGAGGCIAGVPRVAGCTGHVDMPPTDGGGPLSCSNIFVAAQADVSGASEA